MGVKFTKEDFVEKSRVIHGDKYDYYNSVYNGMHNKLIITCKLHGDFEQTPNCHIYNKGGCPKCNGGISFNKTEFLHQAYQIHGNLFDYSKVYYVNNNTKVAIICSIHGVFLQRPSDHIHQKQGCPKCGGTSNLSLDEFIEKAKLVHGNKYDYSLVIFKNVATKINIICSLHNKFLQRPNVHLKGQGCPICGKIESLNKRRKSLEDFIGQSNVVHNNKYDYSLVIYKNSLTKVIIKCKKHGEWKIIPNSHVRGSGCPRCAAEYIGKINAHSLNEFIDKAIIIHNNKYDYSKSRYRNNRTFTIIICKRHGEFYQTPAVHLSGCGCPVCGHFISKPEKEWLDSLNIPAENRNIYLNVNNKKYFLDAFIAETNTVYEFNGDFWHGNPKIYDQNTINSVTKCTFGELYNKTLKKEQMLKDAGYNIISIWESDYLKNKKDNKC